MIVVEDLNKCLRGELSAIETYRRALEKARQHEGPARKFNIPGGTCPSSRVPQRGP